MAYSRGRCSASRRSGLSLSYAVFRFPNFAHGDLVTVGAYGAGAGAMLFGGGLLAAAAGAVAAAVAVTLLADRIVLRPLLARQRSAAVIIAAFAIGLVLRNAIVLLFGPDATAPNGALEIATPVLDFSVFAAARLTATERLVIAGTLVLIVLLHLLLRYLRFGRALRAIARKPRTGRHLRHRGAAPAGAGVGAHRLLCAAAGFSLFLLGPVRPESGAEFMLPALAAVIVGGVGSIAGTLAGALLIGLVESAAAHLGMAEWRQVISFGLIILVLCVRPGGFSVCADDRRRAPPPPAPSHQGRGRSDVLLPLPWCEGAGERGTDPEYDPLPDLCPDARGNPGHRRARPEPSSSASPACSTSAVPASSPPAPIRRRS